MSNGNNKSWSDRARKLVIDSIGHKTPWMIAKELKKRGLERHSTDAIKGIIRRHKENPKKQLHPKVKSNQPAISITSKVRIMYFDIESTDLSAGFGDMLSFGYWWHDEPEPHNINIYDYPGWDKLPVEQRDLYLMRDVAKLIEEADVLIGHYSTKFDTPFIQTRCIFHGLGPIPIPIQIDTWRISRYQLKLNNNRLKTIAKAFGCDEQKDEVPSNIWRRAKAHNLEAMKVISAYNLQDVRTQRSITEKLMPIAKAMPNWNLLIDGTEARCPACGSTKLHRRGFTHTKLYRYERLRCADCGKWMRGRNSITPKDCQRVMH